MAKTQFLTYEIHLTDPDRVAELQGDPPGETSTQGSGPTAQHAIIRAPQTGAAVEFGDSDNGGVDLPLIGPKDTKPTGPYIFSEWFTSTNNFPRDAATFVRKSGGWFGIPLLFGQTTRFYWRGVFVYDAPQDSATGDGGAARAAIAARRWVETFHLWEGQATSESGIQTTGQQRWMSRDAARAVDGYGFAMRGSSGTRLKSLTGNFGGGASVERESWERLYVRLRKLPSAEVQVWRSRGTSNESGAILRVSPSGQLTAYNSTSVAVITLLGSSTALTLNRWYRLDILVQYNRENAVSPSSGSFTFYLNGSQALAAIVTDAVGGMGQLACNHVLSEIGSSVDGHGLYFDIGFWMNAQIPAVTPLAVGVTRGAGNAVSLTGLDWVNGSRGVLIRPNGMSADNLNWSTTDWRKLGQRPARAEGLVVEGAVSTTSGAKLAVTTDVAQSIAAVPGSLGCVALSVAMYSFKGANNGTLGYRLPPAAAVLTAITQNAPSTLGWNANLLLSPSGGLNPVLSPNGSIGLELQHVKGADVTSSKVTTLAAVAELIGTFGDEDYAPGTPVELIHPLPFLGIHNAPYPRTPWARTPSPPFAPVVIQSGTYAGNSTEQDLTFRAPVHFLFIRRLAVAAGSPKTVRWWSSKLAASQASEESPMPWFIPDQLIDPAFVPAPAGGAPTGVGALPDRSADVTTIVNANLGLLDTDDHKRDLLGVIVRSLNATYGADGNNWGLLTKTDRTPNVIPTDIIMWKPTGEHIDVLTDTGPTWINDGVAPAGWNWTAVTQEGSQEQQTIIRIAGSSVEVNQTGQTYVYVAISDPAQRYMLNGATTHRTENIAGFVHALIDTGFTPVWGFFHDERPGTAITVKMAIKGPGNAAASMTKMDGTQLAAALTFGAGTLTLGAGAIFASNDVSLSFSLFRMIEPLSVDPGRFDVVRLTSYVGNGAGGTRSISLTNASGKRPLWAAVQPDNAYGWFKDASHAGGNATSLQDGSQGTIAIVSGAPDEIVVGTTLNANGIVYNVFAIMGGATPGADGFSIHGEFIPVEPTSPTGSEWGADPEAPTDDTPSGDEEETVGADTPGTPGGGADDMTTDLATDCLPFTTRLVNIALSRVGSSKQVANLATDLTEEAVLARLHYAAAVEATLRDFPWPFATRYAKLDLLSGSTSAPVNRDWTYAYRQPSDCVFERRIVVTRGGAVNPTPPPFDLSYDATGVRIFTNQASATLEYTARPDCTASVGDPLFRDALGWKLAGAIGGPLTRNPELIKHCADQYAEAIAKAVQVIQPGNPGPRVALDTQDSGTGCAAANLAVANRALIRIGAQTIANLDTEQSREANAVRVIFEAELKATLRDYPWAFTTKYETALVLVDGSVDDPANDDWTYAYRYPTDCIKVRRIVTESRRAFDPQPEQFRVGQDVTGDLLYCDRETPTIEYTARIPCVVGRGDALFTDAFAWRLAASLAPSLAQVDPAAVEQQGRGPADRPRERKVTEAQLRERAAQGAWRMYYLTIEKARVADASEAQPDQNPGDAEWIRGRE